MGERRERPYFGQRCFSILGGISIEPDFRRTDAKDLYPARIFFYANPEIALKTQLQIQQAFVLSEGKNDDCFVVAKVACHSFPPFSRLIFKVLSLCYLSSAFATRDKVMSPSATASNKVTQYFSSHHFFLKSLS